MLVRELVSQFLAPHIARKATNTAATYRKGLAWLVSRFGEVEWEQLDRLAVREALEASYRRADGSRMADATERRNKVAFELLQKDIVDEREISERIVLKPKDLKRPGSGRRERIPTSAELDQLVAAASPAFSLVLRAFRCSGMRPGEICRADVGMIDGRGSRRAIVLKEHKTARKTGEARRIALGKELAAVVDQAIVDRFEGPIWVDDRGGRWTERRICDRFRALKRRLGLPPELVPYSVRHFVGTRVTKRAGIHAAQQLLGHKSIGMTQRYVHGDDDDQLAAQEAIEGEGRKAA
jgi:integrase